MKRQAAVRTFLFAGVAVLVLGSSARASSVTYVTPIVSWGPNRLDVFVVGRNDGHLWHTAFNGVAWQTWDDRGGPEPGRMPGAVSVVSWGSNRLDVFMGGGQYQDVWHTAWNGSSWQPWDDRGRPGSGTATSLSAVSWGPNRLDVFTIDTAHAHLWQLTWNGSTWVPWTDRNAPAGSGQLSAYATAVTWGANRIDVFAKTLPAYPLGGTVWHTAWNGTSWQGWDGRGSPPDGAWYGPMAVSWGLDRLDLFTFSDRVPPSGDFDCWHDSWNGSNWETAWDDLGSPHFPFTDDLNAVSWGPDRLDVFGIAGSPSGTRYDVWHNSWDGYAWQAAWDDRGSPTATGAVRVWVASWGYQRLDVFTLDVGNAHLWQQTWNGSTWLPWTDLGMPPPGIAD